MAGVNGNDEERVIARGLRSPGPVLLVRTRARETGAARLRVIVSDRKAAEEVAAFLAARGAPAEIDAVGDEYHVIADLARYKDVD